MASGENGDITVWVFEEMCVRDLSGPEIATTEAGARTTPTKGSISSGKLLVPVSVLIWLSDLESMSIDNGVDGFDK